MIEFGWQLAFITVMIGGMYTSYRIGFKDGTGKMIDFCKSKADKRGMTLMHFFGENIECDSDGKKHSMRKAKEGDT